MKEKMQKIIFIILLGHYIVMPLESSEILKFNESFGSGAHNSYSANEWHGREIIISRVASKGGEFILVKTSESDYKVFLDKNGERISLCNFNQNVAYNPIRFEWPTYLVDVWMQDDQIAMLFTDGRAYSYVRSTKKLPTLEKGQHYLMTLLDDLSEWKVIFVMRGLDFGDPEDSILNDTYQTVKLTSIDELDISYKIRDGATQHASKKINLSNGKIELKGKEIPFSKTQYRMIIDEEKLKKDLLLIKPDKFKPEDFKKEIIRACGSQTRAVDFFKSFEDKELSDKIIKMIDESFR